MTKPYQIQSVSNYVREAAQTLETRAKELREFATAVDSISSLAAVTNNPTFVTNVARQAEVVGHANRAASQAIAHAVNAASSAVWVDPSDLAVDLDTWEPGEDVDNDALVLEFLRNLKP